jgi:hypothetical protein
MGEERLRRCSGQAFSYADAATNGSTALQAAVEEVEFPEVRLGPREVASCSKGERDGPLMGF